MIPVSRKQGRFGQHRTSCLRRATGLVINGPKSYRFETFFLSLFLYRFHFTGHIEALRLTRAFGPNLIIPISEEQFFFLQLKNKHLFKETHFILFDSYKQKINEKRNVSLFSILMLFQMLIAMFPLSKLHVLNRQLLELLNRRLLCSFSFATYLTVPLITCYDFGNQ